MIQDILPFISQQWHFAWGYKSVMVPFEQNIIILPCQTSACKTMQKGKWSDHISALITNIS